MADAEKQPEQQQQQQPAVAATGAASAPAAPAGATATQQQQGQQQAQQQGQQQQQAKAAQQQKTIIGELLAPNFVSLSRLIIRTHRISHKRRPPCALGIHAVMAHRARERRDASAAGLRELLRSVYR